MLTHREVVVRWLHRQPSNPRGIVSSGELLFSYSMPIARHLGHRRVAILDSGPSTTTRRHINLAARVAGELGHTVIRVTSLEQVPDEAPSPTEEHTNGKDQDSVRR